MAMIHPFPGNTKECSFEYHRHKVGHNYFVCYYKNSSTLKYDPIEVRRVLGCAKFTNTGNALKAWAVEMVELYGDKPPASEGVADTSFASEAMEEQDPTSNTRMIT